MTASERDWPANVPERVVEDDRRWDRKHGIKEGSWQDKAIDRAAAARARASRGSGRR